MTTLRTTALCSALACILSTGSAMAQNGPWTYSGTFYLFAAETENTVETDFATVDSELSFGDALENLDLAFMGAFEARNGRWGLMADYMLTDLKFEEDTPSGILFSDATVDVKTQILTLLATYRIYADATLSLDLGAGLRWFGIETDLELKGARPGIADRSASIDESWTDGIIAMRARTRIADRWTGTFYADYGGFTDDSQTWQVLATVGYELSDNWVLRGGYRFITFDHEIDGNDFSMTQSGPVLGITYRF